MSKCVVTHPPGNEIYRSQEHNILISVFEIDGAKEKIYCHSLSYLAKFFLDHKSLYFDDTKSFYYYIVTQVSNDGCHFLCYFSKEKDPEKLNNLSCIMALPCYQRMGLGMFMISLSYGLSRIEKKRGSPEAPISDLGLLTYRKYWATELLKVIKNEFISKGNFNVPIETLADITQFQLHDIIFTLLDLGVLEIYSECERVSYDKDNYNYTFDRWGRSASNLNGLIEPRMTICYDKELFDRYINKEERKLKSLNQTQKYVAMCKEKKIHWVPHYLSNPLALQPDE